MLSFHSRCPNLSRPVKPKTCDTGDCSQEQICVPHAPLWLPYFAKHTLERTAPGLPGNRPRSATTWTVAQRPKSLPGLRIAAEIKRQKTRRQEGDTLDAIFLLLEGHRQSPRRRRGRRPRAHGARSLVGLALGGPRLFFQDTRSPGDCGALPSGLCHTQLSSTRNPQLLPPPSAPFLSVFGCYFQNGRSLLFQETLQ